MAAFHHLIDTNQISSFIIIYSPHYVIEQFLEYEFHLVIFFIIYLKNESIENDLFELCSKYDRS